jgi:hypothetical protein
MSASRWRTTPLPPGWERLRKTVLERDGWRCTWDEHGARCEERATDVDHIGNNTNHTLENLRSLCSAHHRSRTASQGGRAANEKRKQMMRRTRRHPGAI